MTSAKVQRRQPRPELSYSTRLVRNTELLLGPWFVLFGSFGYVEVLLHPGDPRPHEALPLSWIPLSFVIIGFVACYLAFFRRVARLEVNDGTLYWFTVFRRLKGQARVAEIATIWTSPAYQWRRTQTVLEFRDGRRVGVRDDLGIATFVANLVAISPDINIRDWTPREPPDHTIGSSYPNNGDY